MMEMQVGVGQSTLPWQPITTIQTIPNPIYHPALRIHTHISHTEHTQVVQ